MADNYNRIIKNIIDSNLKIIVANQKSNETNFKTVKYIYEENEQLKEVIQLIRNAEMESLNKQQEPDKWIPCSERLPDEKIYGKYLVCLKNGVVVNATYFCHGEFKEISTYGVRNFYETNPVIAWQPLPQPYKE
jgi:hypothetical protein